jgi:hypothetical protein
VLDATAGLNQFFADCAAIGAIGYLGPGAFRITGGLTCGTATGSGLAPPAGTAIRSKPVAFYGAGGACEYNADGTQAGLNAIRAATTIFADPAFPANTPMLKFLGPGVLNMGGFLLNGTGVAQTGFEGVGVDKPAIFDVYIFGATSICFNFHQNDAWSPLPGSAFVDDPNGGEVVRCQARSLTNNSCGFQIGSSVTNAGVDISLWTFRECEARMGGTGIGAGVVSWRFQYCDALIFDHCTGDAACHVNPPAGDPLFPTNLSFLHCSIGAWLLDNTWTPDPAGGAFRFLPMYLGSGELLPGASASGENVFPWGFDKRFSGYTDAGRAFGYAGRGNAVEYALVGLSQVVTATTVETPFQVRQVQPGGSGFPVVRSIALDQGKFNNYGATGRLRMYGNYGDGAGGAGLRMRLRLGSTPTDIGGPVLCDSLSINVAPNHSSQQWSIDTEFYTLVAGGAGVGVIVCQYSYLFVEGALKAIPNTGPGAEIVVDLTALWYIVLTAQWDTNAAANNIICTGGSFDAILPGMLYDRP